MNGTTKNKHTEQEFSKTNLIAKCYKCKGYGNIVVNCTTPVKIVIIDGALIEAPESKSEEFIYYVDEVGDDFDDDHEGEDQVDEELGDEFDDNHEGEDVAHSCIREAPSIHLPVVSSLLSQSEEKEKNCNLPHVHQNRRQELYGDCGSWKVH